MELKDINKKLNMNFEVYFDDWSKITEISRELGYEGQITLLNCKETFYFYIFFPKNGYSDKYKYLFPLFTVEERENYYMAIGSIENRNIKDAIEKISRIDGLIINSYRIKKGRIVMDGVFHSNKLKEFSDIILAQMLQSNNINKIVLKPNPGMYIKLKDENLNLKNIVISIKFDEFYNNRVARVLKDTDTIIQIVDNYPDNNKFRIVLYSNDDLTKYDGINVVSSEDGVYTTRIEDDFLSILGRKAFESRISWQYAFAYEKMGRIYASFLIPDYRGREYLDMIFTSQLETKINDLITIENYSNILKNE